VGSPSRADQKASPNACLHPNEEAAGLNGDFSSDVHAAVNYNSTHRAPAERTEIQEFDCLADCARSGKERFPGRDSELAN
jgi:hypothetical protein